MSALRLLLPAAGLALAFACDSLQPTQVNDFGDDTYVAPDDDPDPVTPADDTDDDGVGGPQTNNPPHASAPNRITAEVDDLVFLDGSASSDVDGDPLTYRWELKFKPGASIALIENPTYATAQIRVERPGSYEIHLTVSDGSATDRAVVTVTVASPNTPPIAEAGMNQTTLVGSLVQLSGAGSYDPEGQPLSYTWRFVSRPPTSQAILVGTDVQPATSPRFTADAVGQFVVELVVSDGAYQSAPDTVYITVNPSDPGSSGGGSDDCLSCAEGEQVGRRFSMGDAGHGLGMALLPLLVLAWGRRRDP